MELWDLYTADKQPTGKTMVRGDERPEGCYNLAVSVWIRNQEGKYLISQRSASKKSYPLMWETVAGGVITGETSLQGAVREAKEEVGLELDPAKLRLVYTQNGIFWNGKHHREIADVYLYEFHGEYDEKLAVSEEVAQSKWLTSDEIRLWLEDGRMISVLSAFFDRVDAC